MFRNVLVGVDRYLDDRDAVTLAKRLVAPDGRLTLVHVYQGDPRPVRASTAEYETLEQRRAFELLAAARDRARVTADLRYLEASSAARGLHELAEAVGADLLVLGSSRTGLLGRVLLGDDAREALNGAPCAVAIAPSGYAEKPAPIHAIGVAYNDSPESDHALSVARELAAEHGARLSACEAIALPVYTFLGGPVPIDSVVEDLVEQAQERIASLGGVEPHAVYGDVVDELALYSASVDLLVVGSRGYGPIGRLVHGTTSSRLARTARCPLLVLTRAALSQDLKPFPALEPSGARHAQAT
ncbi:MAG TPA: universal stress protein [Solirubrobacteraceae bacterium]|nr:universal stress protein [Solirubrobacteraceae bacterium]